MSFAGNLLLLREILGTNADTELGRRHGQDSEYQTKRKSLRDPVGGAVVGSGPRRSTP